MFFRNPKKELEQDLQQPERLVQMWQQPHTIVGTRVSCPVPGILGLQHQAEKIHYQYSYEYSLFSPEQVSRYHSCLGRIPEKYKVNLEIIAETAKEDRKSDDKERGL